MTILNNLLLINGVDVFVTYGAFLAEDRDGEMANYSALLKPPAAKPHVCVNFREQNGEKLPSVLVPAFEARDIVLQFAILAANKTIFLQKYAAFVAFLKNGASGWLNIHLPELSKTYRVYYMSCTEYGQLTSFETDVAAKFSVKFREPEPSF